MIEYQVSRDGSGNDLVRTILRDFDGERTFTLTFDAWLKIVAKIISIRASSHEIEEKVRNI